MPTATGDDKTLVQKARVFLPEEDIKQVITFNPSRFTVVPIKSAA
jgi:hypothetical protein